MELDWVKISEMLFSGLIEGLISAATVVVAYMLGKKQADINWKREKNQREKEHQEQMEILKEQNRLLRQEMRNKGGPGLTSWDI